MTEREQTLMRAVLQELANTPDGYKQPHRALTAAVRLAVYPEPKPGELDGLLEILEAEAYVKRSATLLSSKAWVITETGRKALDES